MTTRGKGVTFESANSLVFPENKHNYLFFVFFSKPLRGIMLLRLSQTALHQLHFGVVDIFGFGRSANLKHARPCVNDAWKTALLSIIEVISVKHFPVGNCVPAGYFRTCCLLIACGTWCCSSRSHLGAWWIRFHLFIDSSYDMGNWIDALFKLITV